MFFSSLLNFEKGKKKKNKTTNGLKKGKNIVGKGPKGPAGGPVLRAHQLLKCYVNQPNQHKAAKELKTLRHIVDLLEGVIKKKKESSHSNKVSKKKSADGLFPPSETILIRKETPKN